MTYHPRWNPSPRISGVDVSSRAGADMLAREIRQRWAECGVTVTTEVYEAVPSQWSPIYGIRINGLNEKLSGAKQ